MTIFGSCATFSQQDSLEEDLEQFRMFQHELERR